MWTSADEKQTFYGRLLEIGDGKVSVEKDGENLTFPISRLSDTDRRFLGQGVTIITVDGTRHEDGSVTQILPDAILFKNSSGTVSIPLEELPEAMRSHFAYDPDAAEKVRKEREQKSTKEQDVSKTFPYSVDDLIDNYNKMITYRDSDLKCKNYKRDADSVSYFVNNPERIIITFMTSDRKYFKSFFFVGSGDGSSKSGADILVSIIYLFRAFERDFSQEGAISQVTEMIKSAEMGKTVKYDGKNGNYVLTINDETGFVFGGDAK